MFKIRPPISVLFIGLFIVVVVGIMFRALDMPAISPIGLHFEPIIKPASNVFMRPKEYRWNIYNIEC